tara:strand:- start:2695 stop:3363 length:669 start_codon:yes stop_codon:yes gene_type:complete
MLIKSKKINNKDVLCAKYQYKGRGQQTNRWFSSYGNNLLCSLYLQFDKDFNVPIYALNFVTSLSVLNTVKFFSNEKTLIKWPNDILSGNHKISGILIENIFMGNDLSSSIIGIGINVNQTRYKNLRHVTSLKKITGKNIDPDKILDQLLKDYDIYFKRIHDINYLSKEVHKNLYGKNKCKFLIKEKIFNGKVERVLNNGNLVAYIETIGSKEFRSSEIKIIY